MAEHPKNDEAAEIVGAWKRDAYCVGVFAGQKFRGTKLIHCACGHCHQVNPGCATAHLHVHEGSHISRPPDMRTPAMVVKMIEWLLTEDYGLTLHSNYGDPPITAVLGLAHGNPFNANILADAVLLAVISTKESTDGKD